MSSETRRSGSPLLHDSASEASSRSSFNWTPRKEDVALIRSLADSLLASVSEITVSVALIEVEQETFIGIGCYFYRASMAIMELKTSESAPPSAIEILQSLSKSIESAKDLLLGLQKGAKPASGSELASALSRLEELVKSMGEQLSSIPSSAFKDEEYAEVAIRSLSREMSNSSFAARSSQREEKPSQEEEEEAEEEEPIETDLYSMDVQMSMQNSYFVDPPSHVHETNSGSIQVKHQRSGSSLSMMPQVAQYTEPLYGTFFCPLTKEIMDDPVTIETGVSYERRAISEWFEKQKDSGEVLCPSGKRLSSRFFNPNIALKSTIEEWKERNEVGRIKVARAALSLASSENMVFEAIKDVHGICLRKPQNKVQVCSAGMLPLLAKTLEFRNQDVRCAALELLCYLAEDDNEIKEMIAEDLDLSALIRMLSSNYQPVRHASLILLLELSKCISLCERIGSVAGAILMLITIKYRHSMDAFASEKAGEALKSLEQSPTNIKRMAENGLLEPLITNLSQGDEETKTEMASYLGEIVLGHDSRAHVAERASPALVAMVRTGNALARRAAFKALAQISSHHSNARALDEAGIVQIMGEELFDRSIHDELVNSKTEAASILANILESGLELENRGETVSADYIVYNSAHMLKSSPGDSDELSINLIRILLCMSRAPNSMARVVSAVRESEASHALIDHISSPREEIAVAAMKLLIALSPKIGNTIAERLCNTGGQPEGLVRSPADLTRISEKQAISAVLLSKLPHQNSNLNSALISRNAVPIILQTIGQIQKNVAKPGKHTSGYLEGLVGILVRFTTTLYDPQAFLQAKAHNFTAVFTELLARTWSDEVQRLSAVGLRNLSSESVNLSKLPEAAKRPKLMRIFSRPKFLMSPSLSRRRKSPLCPVHRGECSSAGTFCLVEANAVERLMACLDHENPEVVEASLSAIITLLDDRVDLDKSVTLLSEVNAVQRVLNVVREHREEGLRQKSFWMIEKFLMIGGDRSVNDISQDRLLPSTLVSAFQNGDGNTRHMAEKILRHLNMMPSSQTSYYTM